MSEMHKCPDPSRRGLLTGKFFTRDGRKSVERQQQPLGACPPWHQQVMAGCSHCEQECVTACSQRIIKIHPQQHTYAGTPWLDFRDSGCTLCGECAEACPAIESYDQQDAKMPTIHLDENSCLSWNNVLCMSCIGRCNVKAIKLNERRQLTLKNNLCTGCGMCIQTCPVDALAMQV